MNDQSGLSPGAAAAVPLGPRDRLAASGLREVVIARAHPEGNQVNVHELLRIVSKWWWLIGGIVIGFVLAAVVISLLITPKYRAEMTIEVNPENARTVQVGDLQPVPLNAREFVETQVGLLKSRALAERVVRDLNLGRNESIVSPDTPRAVADKAAADLVRASMTVEAVRDSRLINVDVVSTDPELAARIANSYGENFIQSNLERRYDATSYARNFLENRIATVKDRLEQTERELVAYAKRQGIVTLNVDTGSDSQGGRTEQSVDAASLVALNDALASARADRIAAEEEYRQTQQNSATTDVLNNATIQTLTAQRAELQSEYQQKLGIFQPDYPEMAQMRARIASLDTAIRRETAKVGGASRSEYQAALAKERQLEARVNALKGSLLDLRERSIQYTILQREVDTNRALYDSLLQRYKEVGVAGGVGANETSIVDPAGVPTAPFQPNLPLNILFGLMAGLVTGLAAAFGLEWMDDTIKTPDDVNNKLGIASLGVIPATSREGAVAEQLDDARSQVSEAYQSVRVALQFSTDHGIPKSLLITSTRASEGKSSSTLALARTLASLGASVLIIDSDLRKPTFKGPTSGSEGLSSLLAGAEDVKKCIHRTDVAGLSLLPAGSIPPNPAELLASGRFQRILDRLENEFDHIIVDAPPVLGLADAPLLASICEGTVMIVEAGNTQSGGAECAQSPT
jgi:polysaccharide biosynthesis transport protein